MSAFYLLGVVAIWMALTGGLWTLWRRGREGAGAKPGKIDGLFAIAALMWLATSFWYGGGRKYYYDAEVDRLCAIDGGIKVYEMVRLPAERFNKYGNIGLRTKQYAKPTDEYYLEMKDFVIKTGEPSLVKHVVRVIRRSDEKAMGDSIHYGRGGGDIPGPWHPSSHTCPDLTAQLGLENSIFVKEIK